MPTTTAKRKAQNRAAQRKHREKVKAQKERQDQQTLLPPQSVSVVIPPPSPEPAPIPPSQPPYDPSSFAAVDPLPSNVAPLAAAEGNTITPWQPNYGSSALSLPEIAFPVQVPPPTTDFSQIMMKMLESQRAVKKRQADAVLTRIRSANVIRRNRLEATKQQTTLLEIGLERERVRRT